LIKDSQEAQKEQEKCGPPTAHPPSLLPHILFSRYNWDYKWPPKLLQGPSQAKPNTKTLENPYLLKDPDEDLDPFLLDLTDLEPLALAKTESAPALSTLFGDASSTTTEEDPQTMTTTMNLPKEEEEELPMKTPMATCRIMSPSPWLSKSEPWDPYPESLTGTGPKPMPSLQNSWDTSC
jgi:hypothetical protein